MRFFYTFLKSIISIRIFGAPPKKAWLLKYPTLEEKKFVTWWGGGGGGGGGGGLMFPVQHCYQGKAQGQHVTPTPLKNPRDRCLEKIADFYMED